MLPWQRSPLLVAWMVGLGMRLKLFLNLGLWELPWFCAKWKLRGIGLKDSLIRIWQ